jgi:hypothetical protein
MEAMTGTTPGKGVAWGAMALMLVLAAPAAAAPSRPTFDPGLAGFRILLDGEECPYNVFAFYVRPDERIPIEIDSPDPLHAYALLADRGTVIELGAGRWAWRAPRDAGQCELAVLHGGTEEIVSLHAFVMVPFEAVRDGELNGYRIGKYPRPPTPNDSPWSFALSPRYSAPPGFIEVTPENIDTQVSPHFTLRQFLCKQESGFPKYLVLTTRLLLKLERILEEMNRLGHPVSTFAIMSGYRTPFYNAAIGNVSLSRHQYGDAADVYVDENGDGNMDDLNGDRRVNVKDSGLLYGIIDGMQKGPALASLTGGIGLYEKTSSHGPFVHVDARGRAAHW